MESRLDGRIVVHRRTGMYDFEIGAESTSFSYVDATYSGDLDGPAVEVFVAVQHPDGAQSHYGYGTFSGVAAGRAGTLIWKFTGHAGGGEIEILHGTADLASVQGGAVTYAIAEGSTNEFTYSGVLCERPELGSPTSPSAAEKAAARAST
jgi:hypothetical protein